MSTRFWVAVSGALVALTLTTSVQAVNLVTNGDFDTDANGWSYVWDSYGAANWAATTAINSQIVGGYDGQPGWFWLNSGTGETPETHQLVTGLVSGQTYTVSGYYARDDNVFPDGAFRVLMDNAVYFTAGGLKGVWTPFSFQYVATDADVLLRFQSQVTGDEAYGIDHIGMTPEPSALLLLAAGAFGLTRRKHD